MKLNGNIQELAEKQYQLTNLLGVVLSLETQVKDQVIAANEAESILRAQFSLECLESNDMHAFELKQLTQELEDNFGDLVKVSETRNTEERSEFLASQRKQMDDLRAFYAAAAINAKKEAEIIKATELLRLQMEHDDYSKAMEYLHIEKLKIEATRVTEQKDVEIFGLVEVHDETISTLQGEILSYQRTIEERDENDTEFRTAFQEMNVSFEGKIQELAWKDAAMKRAR